MKILVVEDSLFVQNIIRRMISENIQGCEVITANNGEKGYETYLEMRPDLITTDLLMPILTGQELIRKIRQNDKKTRVIVISADVQKATKEEVEELGISGFFSKPVTSEKVDQLIKLITEACHVE